jgi:predicted membrane protein
VTVGVGVGVGSGVGVGEGVGVGVGVGVGFLIATPLFQTSFLPDLTQVNLMPLVVLV